MKRKKYTITISDRQDEFIIDEVLLKRAVETVFLLNDITEACLDVAIVSATEMQYLNQRHLGHDYAADVLSFLLNDEPLEGEVIVCPSTASKWSDRYDWDAPCELLLYVVHGTLHLVGYDDLNIEDETQMRLAEKEVLEVFHLAPPWEIKDATLGSPYDDN